MGRVGRDNFYQVSGWMITDLGLTGRELHVYAIIYGFTQDRRNEFRGSLTYIMEWLGTSSFHTALRAINKLIDMGLISKRQTTTKGVTTNYYKAILPYPTKITKEKEDTAETVEGHCRNSRESLPKRQRVTAETAEETTAETADNNNTNNNINNNIYNYLGETAEKNDHVPYQKIKELYNDTCKSLAKVITISEARKKAIAARWKEYGGDIAVFTTLFTMAEESTFLKGGNERNWQATFDWLLKQANMAKVLEGNYRDKGDARNVNRGRTAGTGISDAGNKPKERAITTAELEEKLRKTGQFKGYPDFDAMFGGKSSTAGEANEHNIEQ